MSKQLFPAILALLLAALACNMPFVSSPPTTDPGVVFTAAALTVQAISQSTPLQTPVAPGTPVPTQTDQPGQILPSSTPSTPPSPTNTSSPCNMATFIEDVTYPDNSYVEVNKAFTKTWRLKNVGTCTWTSSYQLVFDSGDVMGGPAAQTLTSGTVAPSQTLDVSVNLIAPPSTGTYRGNWRIREPGGAVFGLTTGNPFWVQIKVVAAGSQNPSLPGWPTLKKGNQGKEVTALQYLLNAYGYNLTVDGNFGIKTKNAVEDFQQQKGLKVDGIVGAKTWTKLAQKQVSYSSSGDAVRAVQYILSAKYGYGTAVDGIFGANTRDAVKDFQSKKGLSADGIVGPQTWQALISY